jgi:hypothetical protein
MDTGDQSSETAQTCGRELESLQPRAAEQLMCISQGCTK